MLRYFRKDCYFTNQCVLHCMYQARKPETNSNNNRHLSSAGCPRTTLCHSGHEKNSAETSLANCVPRHIGSISCLRLYVFSLLAKSYVQLTCTHTLQTGRLASLSALLSSAVQYTLGVRNAHPAAADTILQLLAGDECVHLGAW